MRGRRGHWPELSYARWRETGTGFHLWAQIIGKYRLAHAPWVNHSWHATFYVTPRGLTTGSIPDRGRSITVDFGNGVDEAMYYSYAYPVPEGFRSAPVEPRSAYFDETLGEFLLPYEAVRSSDDPEGTLMRFLRSTYEAAADGAEWNRGALECEPGRPRVPRRVR